MTFKNEHTIFLLFFSFLKLFLLFFKELTEAVIGSKSPHMDKKIETRRTEALQSLRHETSLHQILPRICTFIHEGISGGITIISVISVISVKLSKFKNKVY